MEATRWREISMLIAIIAIAAWAATTPPTALPAQEFGGRPLSVETRQIQNPPKTETNSPLVVKVECKHGCGYVEGDQGFWRKVIEDPVAAFTALLFFSTLGLFVSTYLLWDATRRTLKHSQKSSEQQLRAYLFARAVIPVPKTDEMECVFKIENSGQTPAYKLAVCSTSWIDDYPDAKFFVELDDDDSPICVGPRDDISVFEQIECDESDVLDIVDEKRAIYLKMAASFEDAFGKPHSLTVEGYMTGIRVFDINNSDRRIVITRCDAN